MIQIELIKKSVYLTLQKFWKNLCNRIMKFKDKFLVGVTTHIRKAAMLCKQIIRKYLYNDGIWVEKTTTRIISPEEVPPDIREKLRRKMDIDITEDLEKVLTLEL